jgi:signal transduction histidine kinase
MDGGTPADHQSRAKVALDCRWTLLRDARGEPKSYLHIDTDITEHTMIEQQFSGATEESIGTLAGGIAHDLNNVLGPIIMSLDLMELRFQDDESRELISIIGSSARRGADMVSQVLSFAHGRGGSAYRGAGEASAPGDPKDSQRHLSQKHPGANKHSAGSLDDLRRSDATPPSDAKSVRECPRRDAKWRQPHSHGTEYDHRRTLCGIDPGRKPGRYVQIQVEDSGTGIAEDTMEKIFEPSSRPRRSGKVPAWAFRPHSYREKPEALFRSIVR